MQRKSKFTLHQHFIARLLFFFVPGSGRGGHLRKRSHFDIQLHCNSAILHEWNRKYFQQRTSKVENKTFVDSYCLSYNFEIKICWKNFFHEWRSDMTFGFGKNSADCQSSRMHQSLWNAKNHTHRIIAKLITLVVNELE